VLQAAIRAVPAIKYALAVLGIVSAIAIIKGFGIDFGVAVFGTIMMIVLMVAIVVFAALTKVPSQQVRSAAFVLMWSCLILTICSAILMFTAAFFNYPKPLPDLFQLVSQGRRSEPPAPPPLTPELRRELNSFALVVQGLGGENLSISGLTNNLREYADSPSKSNWEEVQYYLKKLDGEIKQLEEASTGTTLEYLVAVNPGLYKEFLSVVDEKGSLSRKLHGLIYPHTADQLVELGQIADAFEKLRPRLDSVFSKMVSYLASALPSR
jgi:hypothetical protein